MTEHEAQEIIRMIETGWNFALESAGRKLWRDALTPYRADLATRAVSELSKREHFRPQPADVIELVELWTQRERQEREQRRVLGGRQPDCGTCQDSGWIVVYERPVEATVWMIERGIKPSEGAVEEEYGPCPDCQLGRTTELGAYGDEGFWRGREVLKAEARARAQQRPTLSRPAGAGARQAVRDFPDALRQLGE